MTRQPGAGFAQFFPTAPRVARDRAAEREKARAKTQDAATLLPETRGPGIDASKDLVDGGGSHADGSLLNGSQHQADGYGSPMGELVNTVGSASSLTSTSSSTFSVARQNLPNGSSWTHAPTATPLTSTDSPSLPSHASHPKPNISGPHSSDRALPSDSRNGSSQKPNGSYTEFDPLTDRIPARDPGRSRKGIKCIPNQSADRNKRQSAKPTYKEFGLDDDDAPPPDPRLDENGGHMGYINTDFHLPKSRLRQAPYNLKPYPFNPKTSIGPGPPTQIVVMGFNPLVNFSKVSQIFATFGDIAESSNKMHPETGSYLGFATFQYRDSQPTRSRPVAVKAMDAARRAVRAMQGQKIEAHQVRVEFDPEGRKSRRMLEETLKREKAVSRATQNAATLAGFPTGPKSSTPNPAAGPPPLAPKGPAAQRQSATPLPSGPSKPSLQSKPQGAVEEKPITPQLAGEPYIHVPGNYVPVMPTTVPHMKKRLKAHGYEDIRVDRTGYYIVFPNTASGRFQAERCFRSAHRTEFFNYEFHMLLCLPPALNGSAESRPSRPSNGRTLSPERKLKAERRPGEDKDRRLREEENDLEEEKRQRAKNFDPVLAACEAVRRELAEHLIKHIRTQVAAPAVLDFLKSDSQAATRRRLNLADPAGSLPTLPAKDAGEDSSRVGTPNSGADPIERRTKHLEVSALPRIRKAKRSDKGFPALGFTDPFARTQRRPARNAFRSLHHRLQSDDSDTESDEESDVGASLARETEEPESRPRSRMSTDDDLSKDEFGSWGPREDDSMTEVSLAVSGLPSKKRKLDLDAQTAIKRQKKSDEELFGVTLDHIETDLPVHEISQEATPEVDDIASRGRSISRSETPVLTPDKALAKKSKLKKKSKKQIFEEREASKKKQEIESSKPEPLAVADLPADGDLVKPVKEEKELAPAPAPEVTDLDLFSHDVAPALAVSPDFSLDLASLQHMPLSAADSPELVKLRKKFAAAKFEEPLLWWWQRTRIRELNKPGTSKSYSPAIEGYYVPNSTGCARTEGVKKILNSEKSKYLPHHIKVQKAREAREAKVKDGKDAVTQAPPPAPTKGNSRANRANNRRQVTMLQDELKTSGDPDVFKFNQLKKRKKPVKFARSAIHNWGLYTEENINKDDMIIEYVGEQVRQQISEIREKRYLKQGMGSSYLFRIDDNTVIDATKKGGIARFINHSCMPNCTAKIIKVDGSRRIVIYALRDIARSEELTYDYKFEREIGAVDRIPCLCGTALCKGFLN